MINYLVDYMNEHCQPLSSLKMKEVVMDYLSERNQLKNILAISTSNLTNANDIVYSLFIGTEKTLIYQNRESLIFYT